MKTIDLRTSLLVLLGERPGLTDRAITTALLGAGVQQQRVNRLCRRLTFEGQVRRTRGHDGRIGNFLVPEHPTTARKSAPHVSSHIASGGDRLREDALKYAIGNWLKGQGWTVQTAWGARHGIDVDARRATERWIIEVKGRGSLSAMRVNYFLAVLGELLQRMDDPGARYSIALPDLPQFRALWRRLPSLAKACTCISALFVDEDGRICEVA